jgi:deoxyribonucleoside regulator
MTRKKSTSRPRGRSSSTNEKDRIAFLAEVAAFYYEDELTQDAIGKLVGLSAAMVSRLLKEAQDKGVIEVKIRYPVSGTPELQREFVTRFGLHTARILGYEDEPPERRLQRVGELAARYVQSILTDDTVIATGWGRTLYQLVQAVSGTQKKNIRVVQSMGALGADQPVIDNQEITRELAARLHGQAIYLPAPMIVESPDVQRALQQDSQISRALDLARTANITLVGLGTPDPEVSGLHQAGYVDAATLRAIGERGCVGDLFVNYFDIYGQKRATDLDGRVVGLQIQDLANARHVVLIASSLSKAAAILGALRTGYIKVLVTDEETAREVIRLADEYPD